MKPLGARCIALAAVALLSPDVRAIAWAAPYGDGPANVAEARRKLHDALPPPAGTGVSSPNGATAPNRATAPNVAPPPASHGPAEDARNAAQPDSASAPGNSMQPDASASPAEDAIATPAPPPGPQIQSFGPDDQKLYVVDHGASWSMHAEQVVAGSLFQSWHEAGGPEVLAKQVLDYPFTLSVHHLEPERILERILEGWSYTLHYDGSGRLERVRVYSAAPTRNFKTPRLVETLAAWKQQETAALQPAATAPAAGEAAPAVGLPSAAAAPPAVK